MIAKSDQEQASVWKRIYSNPLVIAYILIVVLFIVGQLLSPGFLSYPQVINVLRISSFLGIVAAGQTLVIISGGDGIDLSVGAIMSLAAVVGAHITMGANTQLLMAFIMVLLVGLALGMINGIGIARLRIPPLVMTLGMSAVIQGLILVYTQGQPKGRAAPILRNLVNQPFIFGIPGILIIWLVVVVAMQILLNKTSFGRRLYAVGNNRVSASLAGIHVDRLLILTYGLCGAFSALAGFMFVGYTTTVFMNIGGDYVLRSVAAVVIGGTSLAGGVGSYIGSVAGAIVLTVLEAILTTVRIGQAGRYMVHGLVLIALLVFYGRQKQLRQ